MNATQENTSVTTTIHSARFNSATLKLEGAQALITCMGIFMSSDSEEQPSGMLLNCAMTGIGQLIESAVDDLLAKEGGVA